MTDDDMHLLQYYLLS